MNRTHASWSNFTDVIEGECIVCNGAIRYIIPADRPDPALLYHATCDPTPILRKRLKSVTPPLLPPEYTIQKKAEVPAPPSAPPPKASAPAGPDNA